MFRFNFVYPYLYAYELRIPAHLLQTAFSLYFSDYISTLEGALGMADEADAARKTKKSPFFGQDSVTRQKEKAQLPGNEKLCFVITKQKSASWADDLYACGRIADLNRVYH